MTNAATSTRKSAEQSKPSCSRKLQCPIHPSGFASTVVLLKTCFGMSSEHSPSHTNEECTVDADYNMATKVVLQTSGHSK